MCICYTPPLQHFYNKLELNVVRTHVIFLQKIREFCHCLCTHPTQVSECASSFKSRQQFSNWVWEHQVPNKFVRIVQGSWKAMSILIIFVTTIRIIRLVSTDLCCWSVARSFNFESQLVAIANPYHRLSIQMTLSLLLCMTRFSVIHDEIYVFINENRNAGTEIDCCLSDLVILMKWPKLALWHFQILWVTYFTNVSMK